MSKYIELEIEAPACWASYLINGDASGLEDNEVTACDKWETEQRRDCARFTITDCGEPYFGTWFGDWGQEGVTGGDLIKYAAFYSPRKRKRSRGDTAPEALPA